MASIDNDHVTKVSARFLNRIESVMENKGDFTRSYFAKSI